MPRLNSILAGSLIATLCAAGPSFAGCIVPSNETCDGAIVMTNEDLPYSEVGILGCTNNVPDKPYYDLFYRFDCTVTGDYTLDMCDSERDAYLRVYEIGCGWSDGDELAVGDDECPSSPPNADPLITVTLQAGQSYWFEIGSWRDDLPWGEPNSVFNFNVVLEGDDCPIDLDGSGDIDFADLLQLLSAWGPCIACAEDLDGSGDVGFNDLLQLLASWGPCE